MPKEKIATQNFQQRASKKPSIIERNPKASWTIVVVCLIATLTLLGYLYKKNMDFKRMASTPSTHGVVIPK